MFGLIFLINHNFFLQLKATNIWRHILCQLGSCFFVFRILCHIFYCEIAYLCFQFFFLCFFCFCLVLIPQPMYVMICQCLKKYLLKYIYCQHTTDELNFFSVQIKHVFIYGFIFFCVLFCEIAKMQEIRKQKNKK